MSVAVVVPREADAPIRNIIRYSLGFPFHVEYRPSGGDLFLYPYETDAEEVHFKISQYMARVTRRIDGHAAFVDLHKYFNNHIQVQNDQIHSLIKLYCSPDQLRQLKRILD